MRSRCGRVARSGYFQNGNSHFFIVVFRAIRGGDNFQRYLRSVCKDTALQTQIKSVWGYFAKRWGAIAKVGWKCKDRPQNAKKIGAPKTQMNMPIRNNFIPLRNIDIHIRNIPIKQKTEVMPRSFAINKLSHPQANEEVITSRRPCLFYGL